MQNLFESFSIQFVLQIHYLAEMAAALVLYIICLFLFFRRKTPAQKFWLGVLFVYLGVIWGITVSLPLPNAWHINAKNTTFVLKNIQWIPFRSAGNILHNSFVTGNFKECFRVIGGNFIMLMPLGVLVPLCNSNFRIGRMVLVAILVPVGIEGLQLVGNILSGSAIRTVEMEDVVLNAAGCILAYLVFAGLRNLFRPKKKKKRYASARR